MLLSSVGTVVWLLIGNVYVWGESFDLYNFLSFITWEEREVNFRFTRFRVAGSLLGRICLHEKSVCVRTVHKLLFLTDQNC